ncbi:hypothetical protein ACETWN_22315, partial [Aeromonas hydrophila]|uniref:hypothetical protein n=1 Tax=Aeromonas hydrophila TaxID=644 RepID=UPI0035A3808D
PLYQILKETVTNEIDTCSWAAAAADVYKRQDQSDADRQLLAGDMTPIPDPVSSPHPLAPKPGYLIKR